ncbi:MAG TPA: hypothetical protein VHG69_03855, partial [Thermoleophilaceae bacterium]|nr:hypothetical protein [Thermoleophilaceae bacterium]
MLRRTALPLGALVVFALAAAPAHARVASKPPGPEGHAQAASPAGALFKPGPRASAKAAARLWATVNICDTFDSPDAMGIRASMPGNGRRQRMYMRFSAQWWSGSRQQWLDVPNGTSPWIHAGSARYVARQTGWTFDFQTPPMGRAYILRGIVEFHWRALQKGKGARRASWKLARNETLVTRSDVPNVHGGDPPGTSKAMCM